MVDTWSQATETLEKVLAIPEAFLYPSPQLFLWQTLASSDRQTAEASKRVPFPKKAAYPALQQSPKHLRGGVWPDHHMPLGVNLTSGSDQRHPQIGHCCGPSGAAAQIGSHLG